MGKRVMDMILAAVALLVVSPVWLLVARRVHDKLGSPVLFRQVRPGLYGQPFEMIKFRPMRDAVDDAGNPLPDDQRRKALGRFFRYTSLYEHPHLGNVLTGPMTQGG